MKSFLIYKHLEPIVEQLTDAEAGELFKAMYEYERTQVKPSMSEKVGIVFTMFKIHLDKGREDYNRKCDINRKNASRKGAVASGRNPVVANRNRNINNNNNTNGGLF